MPSLGVFSLGGDSSLKHDTITLMCIVFVNCDLIQCAFGVTQIVDDLHWINIYIYSYGLVEHICGSLKHFVM